MTLAPRYSIRVILRATYVSPEPLLQLPLVISQSRNDGGMLGRAVAGVGGALAVIAATTMGIYFTVVGLDEADKLASAIGAFIGLAGLALAIYGTVNARRSNPPPQRPSAAQIAPGTVHNEISGGIAHGAVIQARDVGHVALGPPHPPTPPPDGHGTSGEG